MKRTLYWKILLAFWFTFVLINQGAWLVYMFFWEPYPSYERSLAERLAPIQLGAVQAALEQGGLPALERLQATWPATRRTDVLVSVQDGARSSPDVLTALASGPDGQRWQLSYRLPEGSKKQWRVEDIFYFPSGLMIVGTLGGLGFSAALAWYLTRPVQRIRKGFELLAGGDLATRLQPEMGSRRDEIADLARDFDSMAERLQQLVAVRDQLLHDVSHELRSPLARLSQAIALLRQDPVHAAASLERIEVEVRRLDELVGELLSLARAESGEAGRDRYFDLPELVETVLSNASFEAEAKGVKVDGGTLSGREGIVRGNAELMRRALENIVRNAVQVSRPGQTIQVAIEENASNGQFVVTVADEGSGVPTNKLDQMFDPFVRIEESPQKAGYGLGLAIARRAVQALGGCIDARNRVPRGLIVTIAVPRHLLPT